MDPPQVPSKESMADEASTSRQPRDADHVDEDSSSPDQPRYRCNGCGLSYRRRAEFEKHLRTVHPRALISYMCSYCDVEHEDFEALRSHVFARHSELQVYECAHCRCWFRQKRSMERHLVRHEERLKRRTCELCAVIFTSRQKFKAHWSSRHELARDHLCSVCGERFTRSYNLSRHEMDKHPRDGKTRRWVPTCASCGRTFSRKHHLDKHRCSEMAGESVSSFLCSICGKGFGCKENMLRHEKIHSDEKPFKCKDCNSKFTRKEHLQRHLHIHEYTTVDYVCGGCDKVYKSVGALTKHKKTCGAPVAGSSKSRKSCESDNGTNGV